jgi:four helix bundle protein
MGERVLNHEKLLVYQRALQFIEFVDKILSHEIDKINAHLQLDKASTSIPLNIAEGSGKYTPKDKNRFYDIARGSASESSSCLDVLFIRKK